MLVEDHKLDAVIKLPSGAFKPYTGVSTAILLFTKTSSGGTDSVWFYDLQADGFSLDDKRTPAAANDLPDVLARWKSLRAPLPEASRRPVVPLPEASRRPVVPLPEGSRSDGVPLPEGSRSDRLEGGSELTRPRTAQSFLVPKSEIAANNYDLSLNRYKRGRARGGRAPPSRRDPGRAHGP